ncbi:MAG: hypothetical protein Q9N68_08440 [Gammaproteobacteria bacterium]|nr:hypothetical protein [Gammaproteobacteria bacterium]
MLEPHYGEVLYHFYQQDYFSAIVKLLAAKRQRQLSYHETEAELLLAGLYLAYGLHKKAQPIFQRLLQGEPRAVRNRAWYLLAEMSYRRNYRVAAEVALKQITVVSDLEKVGSEWQAKGRLLLAQIQSQTGRGKQALQTLSGMWPEMYARYAVYNRAMIGFSLKKKQALQQLQDLAALSVQNSEQTALQDRANLSLALFYLREKNNRAAEKALLKVSLTGLHSNRALLALGWSRLHQKRYAAALSPWLQLSERSADDLAVQEVWLAIPELLMQWQKPARAAEYYQQAVAHLQQSSEQLEQTRLLLRDDEWLLDLSVLAEIQGHYGLPHLLASHDLQESLWDYRELSQLEDNLQQWRKKIIELKEFAEKPAEEMSLQNLQQRLLSISNRLQSLLPKWRNYVKQLAARQLQKQAARLQSLIQQAKLARAESLERVKGESLP